MSALRTAVRRYARAAAISEAVSFKMVETRMRPHPDPQKLERQAPSASTRMTVAPLSLAKARHNRRCAAPEPSGFAFDCAKRPRSLGS